MNYWCDNVDKILLANEQPILVDAGAVNREPMENFAHKVYDNFHARRKAQDAIDADAEDMQELFELEQEIKNR